MPLAAEIWTINDRGKNGIWGQKNLILEGMVPKKMALVWWIRKSTPKRSCSIPRRSKKGQNGGTYISPNIEEVPSPGLAMGCQLRVQWTSYQICIIAGYTCAGNVKDAFPATNFKENR